ncbi:hypothetical protein OF001_U500005 [Pseudomonas sp. OF001]|nr:hypothetical protein OF001_U500005 [Pseudomonas sp. OF001]
MGLGETLQPLSATSRQSLSGPQTKTQNVSGQGEQHLH